LFSAARSSVRRFIRSSKRNAWGECSSVVGASTSRIGPRDVGRLDLDVLEDLASMRHALDFALVLVLEREGANQAEIFLVIAPGAQLSLAELQLRRVRIDDVQRAQQPLRVLVPPQDAGVFFALQQPFQRLGVPLCLMDRPGLVGIV
jgi:hypothetical protein